MHWFSFVLGLLVGWIIEWIIDIVYWRRRYQSCMASQAQLRAELGAARNELQGVRAAGANAERLQRELTAARLRISDLEAELAHRPAGDEARLNASVALPEEGLVAVAPFVAAAPAQADNLQTIEGIGPVIDRVLQENGIRTFADLAAASPDRLRAILDAAGPRFRMADPQTWSEQARLARDGEWATLKEMQGRLRAGRA